MKRSLCVALALAMTSWCAVQQAGAVLQEVLDCIMEVVPGSLSKHVAPVEELLPSPSYAREAPALRAQTVYDFSTNGGVDRFAFGTYTNSWAEDLEGIRRQCPEVCTEVTQITPDAYDRLAFSDATGGDTDPNRYVNPDPAGQQDESTLIAEFNTLENPAYVLQIDVLWEGYGDMAHHMELYIWDYVQGNWGNGAGLYGENNFMDDGSGDADFVLSGSVTTDVSNYISPTREITLLIYDDQRSEDSFHDYMSVTITSVECLVDGDCDDGLFCNGAETCDTNGVCQPGTPVDCADGVGCTVDWCDEVNDTCVNAPSNGLCDNGEFCDGVETCDPLLDCQAGTPVDCADGVGCTVDWCDEVNDQCVNAPSNGLCENGEFCDGVETCDPLLDCQVGTPVDCADGVGCTVDWCDEVNDECVNAPSNGLCDNGEFCDGVETCDPLLDCQAGTPVDCDDGVGCTFDLCDEVNDVCFNAPNNILCDNGVFCDGAEMCDPVLDCQPGTDPCGAGEWCDEVGDACIPYGDGDFDVDGDVDLADFAAFEGCFSQSALGGCEPANLTGPDEMIDLDDFAEFVQVLIGPQ